MKKAILALVIVFAVLLSACSYRYVPSDGQHERRIIVPLGKDYVWTDMSRYCIDPDNKLGHYEMSDDIYEIAVKLYRFDQVEYEEYACTKPGLPKEILMYQTVDFQGWFECPFIFVQDGYDMPTFDSADRIENIYYLTDEGYWDWFEKGYSSDMLSGKEISGDIDAFVEELFGYCIEYDSNSSWESRDIEVEFTSDRCAALIYKFKDIDGLFFRQSIFLTDDPDRYYSDYVIDETYYSIILPKELLQEYFPIES